MNKEIKTGVIYNLESKLMRTGKRYLRFTLATKRTFKEDGEFKLNYRTCECYIENLNRFIERNWNKNPKSLFFIVGEGYDTAWKDQDGIWHNKSVTRVSLVELIGTRPYDNGKTEESTDVEAEIDW